MNKCSRISFNCLSQREIKDSIQLVQKFSIISNDLRTWIIWQKNLKSNWMHPRKVSSNNCLRNCVNTLSLRFLSSRLMIQQGDQDFDVWKFWPKKNSSDHQWKRQCSLNLVTSQVVKQICNKKFFHNRKDNFLKGKLEMTCSRCLESEVTWI